jgi:pimeloyl-ACP methyl ester carboxylesterase
MTQTSAFKTVEGEAEYRAAYDATMELWPVPYRELEVHSRFGRTHVVVSGPTDAPPLVLLHGTMTTLTIWLPNIADLAGDYRVYAIDTMGHPSKSIPDEPIKDAAGFVEWLSATLDGLGLDRVSLAGISLGAWIGLGFALKAPERVHKLVLLSPAASLQPLTKQFALRAILSGVVRTRRMMNSFFRWMGLEATPGDPVAQHLLDLIWIGGEQFRIPPETRRIMPTVFSDDELRALDVPALLLIGEHEVIYDPDQALARARRLIPNLQGDLVPECGHGMSFTQHEIVDARVLEFLRDD